MSVSDVDLAHVFGLERELQSRATRGDAARLRELLSPDFVEIGASGRRWDLESILELLRAEAAHPATHAIVMTPLEGRVLAPGVVQVFWDSDQAGRRARRTSLWQRGPRGWQLTYHQATPLPHERP